jgi:drug/metabolite transporter (DMT)-like permease
MFTSMSATIKMATAELPNEVVVFFRNLFGLAVLMPWLLRHGMQAMATREWRLHVLRSLAGLAAMYCFFYVVTRVSLAQAVLLALTAPFFIPFIAWVWLHESIPGRGWGAIAVGFGGVALMLEPSLDSVMDGMAQVASVGLLGATCAALANVSIRRMARTEPALRTVFYYSVIATPVSAIPLAWGWETPSPGLWVMLFAVGAFATAGQLLLARALAFAPAAQLGPIAYAGVLFAAIYGWVLWDEGMGAVGLLGAALICAAGILTGARPGHG